MKRKTTTICVSITVVSVIIFCYWSFISRSEYDAGKIAAAETAMWKAYYTGDRKALVYQLLVLERAQFRLTWAEAVSISRNLANAAMTFHALNGGYEEKVLPDLIAAYAKIKTARNLKFNPETAARAELNWWVARRDPNRNTIESVGSDIGELYGILYGGSKDEFKQAGILRAEAAALRDEGKENADWRRIDYLLYKSYSILLSGL